MQQPGAAPAAGAVCRPRLPGSLGHALARRGCAGGARRRGAAAAGGGSSSSSSSSSSGGGGDSSSSAQVYRFRHHYRPSDSGAPADAWLGTPLAGGAPGARVSVAGEQARLSPGELWDPAGRPGSIELGNPFVQRFRATKVPLPVSASAPGSEFWQVEALRDYSADWPGPRRDGEGRWRWSWGWLAPVDDPKVVPFFFYRGLEQLTYSWSDRAAQALFAAVYGGVHLALFGWLWSFSPPLSLAAGLNWALGRLSLAKLHSRAGPGARLHRACVGGPPSPSRSGGGSRSTTSSSSSSSARRRAAVVAAAGRRDAYAEVQRDALPGGKPNTPWRRLLLSIQQCVSLPGLARIFASARHKSAVWRPVHTAALLMRVGALLYFRVVLPPHEAGPRASGDALGLLCLVGPELRDARVLRALNPERLAELLVVLSALRPAPGPELVDPLMRELLREGGKKLPVKPDLLCELAAALARLGWRERAAWLALASGATRSLQAQRAARLQLEVAWAPAPHQHQQQQQQQQQPQEQQQPPEQPQQQLEEEAARVEGEGWLEPEAEGEWEDELWQLDWQEQQGEELSDAGPLLQHQQLGATWEATDEPGWPRAAQPDSPEGASWDDGEPLDAAAGDSDRAALDALGAPPPGAASSRAGAAHEAVVVAGELAAGPPPGAGGGAVLGGGRPAAPAWVSVCYPRLAAALAAVGLEDAALMQLLGDEAARAAPLMSAGDCAELAAAYVQLGLPHAELLPALARQLRALARRAAGEGAAAGDERPALVRGVHALAQLGHADAQLLAALQDALLGGRASGALPAGALVQLLQLLPLAGGGAQARPLARWACAAVAGSGVDAFEPAELQAAAAALMDLRDQQQQQQVEQRAPAFADAAAVLGAAALASAEASGPQVLAGVLWACVSLGRPDELLAEAATAAAERAAAAARRRGGRGRGAARRGGQGGEGGAPALQDAPGALGSTASAQLACALAQMGRADLAQRAAAAAAAAAAAVSR
ncbi:hypothetical protein HT031_005665 [Scenedesmus sp. PABB004]|nr:hypothetical protein HT031_005665 [Scenedesmus sp. PABB004]